MFGLVSDDPHTTPRHPGKTDYDVVGVHRLKLEELALVDHAVDDLDDIVGFLRIVGNDGVERLVHAVHVVRGFSHRGFRQVVLGDVLE
jgi:hypothetical protein